MKVAVLKETFAGERRVALVPAAVAPLGKAGVDVAVVVVPFCAPQALDANTREIPGEGNLNRNFPGIGDPITATTGSTAAARLRSPS